MPSRGGKRRDPARAALFSLFDDPDAVRSTATAAVNEAMQSGGPAPALERFVRLVAGDANWDYLDPDLRHRMVASAETYFGIESGRFDSYLPDSEALAAITAPVQVLVSEHSHPFFAQAAHRLAERLDVKVTRTAGTHFAYLDHPDALAQTIRPFHHHIGGVAA